MTGEDIQQQDLIISKLLRQDIRKYRSIFPHVSTAIQLSNDTGNRPMKGDTIQYIYTNSQHNNPLRRVVPIEIMQKERGEGEEEEENAAPLNNYDKEKYREMMLDASETVLGYFGFDRTVYRDFNNKGRRKWWWYEELREERIRDIQTETIE